MSNNDMTFPCPPYPPRLQGPSDCPCGAIGPHNHKMIHSPAPDGCWYLTGPIERLAQTRVRNFVAYQEGRHSWAARPPKREIRARFSDCSVRCVNPSHLTDNLTPEEYRARDAAQAQVSEGDE